MSANHLLELAQDVVKRAQAAGATDAECTIAEGDEFSANVRMREVENLKEAGSRGAGPAHPDRAADRLLLHLRSFDARASRTW